VIRVRADQMELLEHVMRERFVGRVCRHLRDTVGEKAAALEDAALRELIRHGLARAAVYGIESEWDLCRYTRHQLGLGRDFDVDSAHPEIGSALRDPALCGRVKMDRIDRYYYRELSGQSRPEAG